jgi:hypothetical protein
VAPQGGKNKASLYALTFLRINECGGKLDIDETLTPSDLWKDNNPRTPYMNQVGTPAVPN